MDDDIREELGRVVRAAWVAWARTQPNPKPSWLVPWDELSEADKEADRCIGEAVLMRVMAGARRDLWDASAMVFSILGRDYLISREETL